MMLLITECPEFIPDFPLSMLVATFPNSDMFDPYYCYYAHLMSLRMM